MLSGSYRWITLWSFKILEQGYAITFGELLSFWETALGILQGHSRYECLMMGLLSCPSRIGYYLSQHTIKWTCIVKFHHPIEVIYTSQAWAEEPHGESPVIRWQGNRRSRPGLQMVLHAMHGPPVCEELQHYGPLLGHSWSTVKKENSPSAQNFGECTSLCTLLARRNGQICDYIPIHGLWPMV